jgi:hypothetical protein
MTTLIKIRHYGVPFVHSNYARLALTGMLHHYVLMTQ